jgi:hypothetical protein
MLTLMQRKMLLIISPILADSSFSHRTMLPYRSTPNSPTSKEFTPRLYRENAAIYFLLVVSIIAVN